MGADQRLEAFNKREKMNLRALYVYSLVISFAAVLPAMGRDASGTPLSSQDQQRSAEVTYPENYQENSEQLFSDKDAEETCAAIASLADQGHLAELEIPAKEPIGDWFSDFERTSIAANLNVDNGRIEQIYLLRLNQSSKGTRFAKVFTGGTCSSESVYNIDRLLMTKGEDWGIDKVDDSDDKIRWTTFGGGEYPINYNNRNFIVTAEISSPNKLRMISWIKTDGRTRPICLLNVTSTRKTVTSSTNPALCNAVANEDIFPLKMESLADKQPFNDGSTDFVDLYDDLANRVGLVHIDIDSSGKKRYVGRLEYDSAAGCGGEARRLHLLSNNLKRVIKNPLNEQLQKLRGTLDIYNFHGEYYVDGNEPWGDDTLVRIRKNKIEKVCEFGEVISTEISKMFSLKN